MTKYLLGLISLWLMCSCSDTDPGETPPIDPPTPTPTVTITKPEFVFGFQGQSKYSYCPSALKQADGTVHLYFCGNPENLIMVDNIFHIKINPNGTQTAAKVYCNLVYQVHGTITIPVTLLLSKVASLGRILPTSMPCSS